jgi:hypothetical protein
MLNHTLIKRSLTAGLLTMAAAFPAGAQAMAIGGGETSVPVTLPAPVATVPQNVDQLHQGVQHWIAVHGGFPSSVASTVSTDTAQPGSTFHWGDAGIGAGGAIVLLGAGGLGAAAMRRRRPTLAS